MSGNLWRRIEALEVVARPKSDSDSLLFHAWLDSIGIEREREWWALLERNTHDGTIVERPDDVPALLAWLGEFDAYKAGRGVIA